MFGLQKKEAVTPEIVDKEEPNLPQELRLNAMENIKGQVSATLNKTDYTSTTIDRTEQQIDPVITRFIGLFDENEDKQQVARTDSFGNPLELMGPLGNIPKDYMPYIRKSNFNSVYFQLRKGIYLDIYEVDKNTGELTRDENGKPVKLYTKKVNVGTYNKLLNLTSFLGFEGNRAKLQAQVMVGNAGTSPLGIGGSWDDTLQLMFGGMGGKKK